MGCLGRWWFPLTGGLEAKTGWLFIGYVMEVIFVYMRVASEAPPNSVILLCHLNVSCWFRTQEANSWSQAEMVPKLSHSRRIEYHFSTHLHRDEEPKEWNKICKCTVTWEIWDKQLSHSLLPVFYKFEINLKININNKREKPPEVWQ